ncbi:MAG: hypothetical protein ACTIIH_01700 [Brevibacterium sp.]|uniref:hypothetical protein n=1 Tax=Brevibacterium sp. TaxID=1701 RepID=UPI003F913AB9
MTERYIDLSERVYQEAAGHTLRRAIIDGTLEWLDEHPDQVPGRTMKKSDYQELMDGTSVSYGVGFTDGFHMAGGSIAPDPEPTNAEKWKDLLLRAVGDSGYWNAQLVAEALDGYGMTAPGDDENAEHDRAWWVEHANVNDAEDCEACVDDLCPVHHGIALGVEFVTKKIAALGDDPELFNSIPNPTKAPGGDHE